jgi:hypothetical protein
MKPIALFAPDELLVCGDALSAADKRHVLSAYVHRFTGEHKPDWAGKPWKDGKPYPLQFANDAEWLAHTRFVVTKCGRLDPRYHDCVSSPTWPFNPELRLEFADPVLA